jgi:hypothetical protein
MEGAIIRQVIDRYGFYSAEKERELIRSKQIRPEQIVLEADEPNPRDVVGALLRQYDRWWSTLEISEATRISRERIISALNSFIYRGSVQRQHPPLHGARAYSGVTQRYRWVR